MVYWNRFISYIYRYHDGRKCENSGFAKVAKTGRTGRITIGLKNGIGARETVYGVYIYRETLPQTGIVHGRRQEDRDGDRTDDPPSGDDRQDEAVRRTWRGDIFILLGQR